MTSAAAAKLIPAHPESVSVIRAVTPNIVTVSSPFLRFGLFRVGGRGTIGKKLLSFLPWTIWLTKAT